MAADLAGTFSVSAHGHMAVPLCENTLWNNPARITATRQSSVSHETEWFHNCITRKTGHRKSITTCTKLFVFLPGSKRRSRFKLRAPPAKLSYSCCRKAFKINKQITPSLLSSFSVPSKFSEYPTHLHILPPTHFTFNRHYHHPLHKMLCRTNDIINKVNI